MEVKSNIDYNQILNLIKQLPANQVAKLRADLGTKRRRKPKQKISEFQEFLLSGPQMTDNQYQTYLDNRKLLNQWRKK